MPELATLTRAILDINAAWAQWATREMGDPGYYESMQLSNAISRAMTVAMDASVTEGEQQ